MPYAYLVDLALVVTVADSAGLHCLDNAAAAGQSTALTALLTTISSKRLLFAFLLQRTRTCLSMANAGAVLCRVN